MRFLSPKPAKIVIVLLLIAIVSPWYTSHLTTLFNPHKLLSCWDILPDGSIPIPCASPFRSFTYGFPVALVTILIFYVIACGIVVSVTKNKMTKHKQRRK